MAGRRRGRSVAGGAEHLYGRARSVTEDAVDAAPGFVDAAKERLRDAGEAPGDAASRGAARANATMSNSSALWALGAAVGGYLLGWLIHGERA